MTDEKGNSSPVETEELRKTLQRLCEPVARFIREHHHLMCSVTIDGYSYKLNEIVYGGQLNEGE